MSGHTPGPWVCHIGTSRSCECRSILGGDHAGGIGEVFVDNGRHVEDGGNACPSKAEAQANARLIAAAPDLLETLKALVAHIDDHVDINNSGGPNWAMSLQTEFGGRIAAAIAKATGQS